jgi:hypothetical protein
MGLSENAPDGFRQPLLFGMLCPAQQGFGLAASDREANLHDCCLGQSMDFETPVNDRARRELTDNPSRFGEGRDWQVAC